MGWKIIVVACLIILWALWPAIRIPKDNFFRRRIGAFGTYLLLILGILAALQFIESLITGGR